MAPTNQQQRSARAKLLAGGKAPKARVSRYLKKTTESKIDEGARVSLLLKGIRCSQDLGIVLKDLRSMLAPHCKLLTKNNAIAAFDTEGQQSLEFLCTKNDATCFVMASHNKKRPNNLIIGRTFDRQILDMVELGIMRYKSISDYGGSVPKKRIGSKPLMLFMGDQWQQDSSCTKLQNVLIDLYKGDPTSKLVASGLDHLMAFSVAQDGTDGRLLIHQRTYFMKLKKNPRGGSSPLPLLTPCGPDMDYCIRRTQMASPDLYKASLKLPQQSYNAAKKKKNKSTNMFGEEIGRLHLEYQNVAKMGGKKSKALKRAHKADAEEEKAAMNAELEREKEEMNREFKQVHGFDQEELDK